jgi:hypothetical protein
MQHNRVWSIERMNLLSRIGFALSAALVVVLTAAGVRAQIDRPGAHPSYSAELEFHGLVQWDVEPWNHNGFGLGARASIPVIAQGPITTVNNSLAVAFGFDWAHASHCHPEPRYNARVDCSNNNFEFPVTVQWNFFFSDVISLLVELGLDVRYETWSWRDGPGDEDDVEAFPQFLIGPRFFVGKNVAIPIRIGWPYLSVGVSFLL